jgi:HK97 family phage portal protein
MNFFKRALVATVATAQNFRFVGWGGGVSGSVGGFRNRPFVESLWNALLPGSRRDWQREAGNIWENSAVSILLRWFCNTFCEAPLIVKSDEGDGTYVEVRMHELAVRLKRPNGHFTRTQLWKALLLSYFIDGNAYLFKVRSLAGKVVQLWWIPHWMIEPRWGDDGEEFITHYDYEVDGRIERLEVSDVVHFRNGVDPLNYRKGHAPLKALLREVATDNQILSYTFGILKNAGVPRAILTPEMVDTPSGKRQVEVPDDKAGKIKNYWKNATTGDSAGDVMVMNAPWKVTPLSFSPKDLSIPDMGDLSESRLAGAFGLPPVAVSLLVGLRTATAKASHAESLKQAYQSGVMPVQREFCEVLDLQLLPELGDEMSEFTAFDYSNVEALQENRSEAHRRADEGYKAGTLKRSEARAMKNAGLQSSEEDEIYFTDLGLMGNAGAIIAGQITGADGSTDPAIDAGVGTDLTLNGAQITAAVSVIERLRESVIDRVSATELLVAVGIPRDRAEAMVAAIAAMPALSPGVDDEDNSDQSEDEDTGENDQNDENKSLRRQIAAFWRAKARRKAA